MSGFEVNKIAGAVLLASLVAAISVNLVDILYKPSLSPKQRGYQVAVAPNDSDSVAQPAPEEKVDIPALMQAANAQTGENVAKKCLSCHSFEEGGPNKVGPNLWAVVGAKKGAHPAYKYSDALMAKGGTWTEEDLFHFLHKPSAFIPGTKMSFAGISKAQEIADIIAFLKLHK
ncbi:MAG: Cytochrome c [Pseudomonadota bacterium]|jgi:cytochrome c